MIRSSGLHPMDGSCGLRLVEIEVGGFMQPALEVSAWRPEPRYFLLQECTQDGRFIPIERVEPAATAVHQTKVICRTLLDRLSEAPIG